MQEKPITYHKRYYRENNETIKKRMRAYRLKNRERLNAYFREWSKKHKDEKSAYGKMYKQRERESLRQKGWAERLDMIAAYGAKCVCCGEKEPRFLTIDHIHNDGYIDRKQGFGRNLTAKLKKLNYPRDRYQLLCFNCNCGRANNKGLCPHHAELLT